MKRVFSLLCLTVILFSCTHNPLNISVSNVSVDLKIKHLDVDLLQLKQDRVSAAIPVLKSSYGNFFNIFVYRMIGIGGSDQENFSQLIYTFVSDTLILKLEKNVAAKVDTIEFRKKAELAFKHYKYYFPAKQIPVIYTCISGFNQSVVTAEKLIGVSLDKYMGANSHFYEQLGLPLYKRRNMHPEKIIPDMMYAWAVTEWPNADNDNSLLSQMIQEGKRMYFLDAILPDLPDTLKIGYTKKQLDFCTKNQASMWTSLAENKFLFSTDRMTVKRFIDDGPYTSAFTDQSPARTGTWIGWQIVRSYMKMHPDVKLPDLLNNTDFQSILNQSGYQP